MIAVAVAHSRAPLNRICNRMMTAARPHVRRGAGENPACDNGANAREDACNAGYSFSRIRPAWTASNTASLRELTASLR